MTGSAEIGTIGVVVPARDEERRITRCLAAMDMAREELRVVEPRVPRLRVIVVVDSSSDRTAVIADRWPDVEVVHSFSGRVGAARAAGVAALLGDEAIEGVRPHQVWIACTDADSAVPSDWLVTQLHHARAGVEMVLGTVRPDPQELADGLLAAWRLRHLIADGHPHVHGANLGIRGDTYLAVGGFADVATHEDLLLSEAVRRAGGRVVSTGSSQVLTSGRMLGRAPDGMARYLALLEADGFSLEA